MQPTSREMQAMAAAAAGGGGGQISLDDLRNGHAADDFLDQMLSGLPSAWPELAGDAAAAAQHKLAARPPEADAAAATAAVEGMQQFGTYDESALLASRLRQHQISGGGGGGGGGGGAQPKQMMLHHQMMLPAMARSLPGGGDGLLLPLSLGGCGSGSEGQALFKTNDSSGGEAVYGGFAGALQQQQQHFQTHPQQAPPIPNQTFGGAAGGAPQPPVGAAAPAAVTGGGAPAPPRQRVRARRGQATDPHSIAERLRRERIAERMKALQELVPNANKTDKATMLDEIIDYVKFLQLQVKVLSMSRLGGAAAVAPLVADMSSEGRGGGAANGAAGSDSLTVTEQQVAKLMEEDMGSAMQYLQGKGLCLMPISLASAISSATCHLRPPAAATGPASLGAHHLNNAVRLANGDVPASPSMSVLTAQSAMTNGGVDGEGSQPKDAASVSKP